MRSALLLALTAGTFSSAVPLTSKHNTVPVNPIKVASSKFLCNVTSDLPVNRDLGFVGKIQNTMIYTYGDTLASNGSFYMTSDSSSIGTNSPCHVLNTQRTADGHHPTDMVAPNSKWGTPKEVNSADAFGGTNVLPTGGNNGMMFFLKNHRPIGGTEYIAGAGVASVTLSASKNVTTSRLAEYWWDGRAGEPWYGDIGAYSDGNYVYGYGHGNNSMYAYMTRAPVAGWKNVTNYQYWNGANSTWQSARLFHPTTAQSMQWNSAEGAVWAVDQGQMIWSPYYKKVVWVYTIDWADNAQGVYGIYARTADQPTGPWSNAVKLYSASKLPGEQFVYCAVANPYFDSTGKSIIVTVDNGPAIVQATRVMFE